MNYKKRELFIRFLFSKRTMRSTSAFIICALWAFFTVSVEGKRLICQTNDDCEGENNCCVKPTGLLLKKGICSEPSEEGDLCDPHAQTENSDNYYRFSCPCDTGLTCQEREVTWGTTKYTVNKCVQ